ncbi:class 1 fructose-bisphosphatase [Azospirillum sp. TSO35-2]|uniref:class 1 fructose-bisphosphatase n=1 Tax=Azospirillum sp. TSO35-2 TaxID=716796 RepID=UPI000D61B9DE|nr:class 1 fructose-bisphosphatase [Azospirillum sp. TSO35-2]PWC39408.1 fructose 1,6-bisphosphatase [Azospirillum sp. TSO35-2]
MPHRRTTFSKFIIEDQRRHGGPDTDLTALLNDVQTACKFIASAVARGALKPPAGQPAAPVPTPGVNVHGEVQKPLDLIANDIMLRTCEYGGKLCGMASEEMEEPYRIPQEYPRGRYLLTFDPLDGSSNVDVNLTVGTIFSILKAPDGVEEPEVEHFLQPGTQQVAAGFALYGPTDMIIATLGKGVHGFTLDREIGAYTLTHPDMRIPDRVCEFAINSSNERFWEPPVRLYVEECIKGSSGPREADFNMRWIASLVAEVYRILIRGGVFLYPRDARPSHKPGRLRLLYEANPVAMLVEQAGGAASTGRERILDIQPQSLHQRVPVILGSKTEVERLAAYHAAYDRGEDLRFHAPLFGTRSLFLTPESATLA